MVLSSATIFWFRKHTKHLDNNGIYKMKNYPLMPILFISAYTFVGISIALLDPSAAVIGIVILLVFIGLYFIAKK